jgi:hypothetical protein
MVTQVELETLGKDELIRAAAALSHTARFGAKPRLDELQEPGNWGGMTFAQIKAASKVLTPGVIGSQVDAIVAAAVRDAEARLSGQIQQVAGAVTAIGGSASVALKGVADLQDAAKRPVDVSAAVRDAVAAAFKPLQDSLKAAPAEVVSRVVAAAPRERRPISEVFDIPGFEGDCEVWGPQGAVDVDYVWPVTYLRTALKNLERGSNFWQWGEKGTGKTKFAEQLAARLGRPYFRVSLDKTSEKGEFIGQDQISAGTSFFAAGQVLQAYVTPGAICLLDEADHTRPDYVTTLHALLEKGSTFTVTSTGEVFKRAPGMVFVAAANTNGTGDMTGRYAGTGSLNSALSDRFAHFFRVSFLPEQQEIDLLFSRHGGALQVAVYPAGLDCYRDGSRAVTREDAAKLVNVFTKCRAEVGGALVEPPSLRRAFAFMEALSDGLAPELAWEIAVVNPSPEDDGTKHEALRQLFTAHWA